MKYLVFIKTLFCVSYVQSANILFASPTHSQSHITMVQELLKGLAEKGHNVTVITPFLIDDSLNQLKQIKINLRKEDWTGNFVSDAGSTISFLKNAHRFAEMITHNTINMMKMSEVQKLLNESFDLIITQSSLNDALFGLGDHFKCPIVSFTSFESMLSIDEESGNPHELSYISHRLPGYPEPLSFKHRVLNIFWYFLDKYYFTDYMRNQNKILYEKLFPSPKYRSFRESMRNVSIYLTAGHFSQGRVRPITPNLIEVGGIQMKDIAAPLPSDLQNWMDESTEGVVYFSMGSNIKKSNLSPQTIKEILLGFQKLPLKVLWKFDDTSISDSDKIRIEKWVPQNDLLQHKNLKVFISHGGWGSVMESKYYGVPMILIPIFGDQIKNSNNVEKQGWGIQIPFFELTSTKLAGAVFKILSDPKFTNQAKYESNLYRDRPTTALNTAIFWVEYVMRHRGAKHMQSNAVHLNFVQYHSLDVIGFVSLVCLVLVIVAVKVFRLIFFKATKFLPKNKKL